MGTEVGVESELVAGKARGGREGEGRGSQDDQKYGDTAQKKFKGARIACVFPVQSPCNNVQQTAAAMRPRSCRLSAAFRGRTVCASIDPTATTIFLFAIDFTAVGVREGGGKSSSE